MEEWVRYADSVDAVLLALGQFRMTGNCPTLLCLPDILVLRDEHKSASDHATSKTRKKEKPKERRIKDAPPSHFLDGHACISALTAAYLCLSLASEYSVLLAVKAGSYGHDLLDDLEEEFRRRGCCQFRSLVVSGKDREIKTRDTGTEVERRITDAQDANQLSWDDIDSFHSLRGLLERKQYGLLIGDVESYLVRRDESGRMKALMSDAIATVIDTLTWEEENNSKKGLNRKLNKELWNTIASLATKGSRTFISVSDSDVRFFATATGLPALTSDNLESVCGALARTIRGGYLVLHGKDLNMIFSCPDGKVRARVPTCEIEVKAANGAGDTFNGGLALAATALLGEQERETVQAKVSPKLLRHILAFATVVVSLRLKNGRYSTRADLLSEAHQLIPKVKDTTLKKHRFRLRQDVVPGSNLLSRGQWLAHSLAPFWSAIPKLALIDLDHTLCDSDQWRLAAAVSGFKALGIPGNDEELAGIYEGIYQNHDAWEPIIGANVRYEWASRHLFELALALERMPLSMRHHGLNAATLLPLESQLLREQLSHVRDDSTKRVSDAVTAFKETAAFPYPDSIAGLYQLRDVLGFKLLLVTEGDFQTQCWKLEALGLNHIFPPTTDTVRTEEAFASVEQANRVFVEAIVRQTDAEIERRLIAAQRICTAVRKSLKASFRAEAVREILQSEAQSKGVHICTFGDRIETDVIPYLDVMLPLRAGGGSKFGGFVIGRLKRGLYADRVSNAPSDTPDFEVNSLPQFAATLATPGFWHEEPTVKTIKKRNPQKLPQHQRELLRSVMEIDSEVALIIEPILRY